MLRKLSLVQTSPSRHPSYMTLLAKQTDMICEQNAVWWEVLWRQRSREGGLESQEPLSEKATCEFQRQMLHQQLKASHGGVWAARCLDWTRCA